MKNLKTLHERLSNADKPEWKKDDSKDNFKHNRDSKP